MEFSSDPDGVMVFIDEELIGITPISPKIKRGNKKTITFKKEGYKSVTIEMTTGIEGAFFANILIGGFFGSTTDGASGAMYRFDPNSYYITLERLEDNKISSISSKTEKQKAKEFIIQFHDKIVTELQKGEGKTLALLLELLNVKKRNESDAVTKLRELSQNHENAVEFSENTTNHFILASSSISRKTPTMSEPEYWKAIKNSNNKVDFKAYLLEFPRGQHAEMARVILGRFEISTPAKIDTVMILVEARNFRKGGYSYKIDESEVTQESYSKVMSKNPSKNKKPNYPVENVTWKQAKKFCEMVGKRLPTGAEWENAARAGTSTRYSFGSNSSDLHNYGNYCGDDCNMVSQAGAPELDGWASSEAPVRTYKPNPWKLYDMHGNVAEWVKEKVVRGGSWADDLENTSSSALKSANPDIGKDSIGFRCARDAK